MFFSELHKYYIEKKKKMENVRYFRNRRRIGLIEPNPWQL